ncbi:MAG: FAD/NAD(P)-binding protein [Candidatus Edwardsbacteria bacterium]|nr:FAD/NAD(P)-binding protein [Candidatus Edwardsbacteria bacterium]MBU1576087.1 FAD/NAD(P)-binding protein [Candidatus Edwardsbacteria bacterium]MBU2462743.1 FAD/NAD(P)-binding protein [Candidatus Edwardsbacteria bacterium]MBU2593222.1 FAD/NAD(P)-binding protein [Candidatus Edwardsbacteria bacterium]
MNPNIYLPYISEITDIKQETPDTRTYDVRIKKKDEAKLFISRPGQFVEASVFGAGEAPFGLTTSPQEPGVMTFTVRACGRVTNALNEMKVGDEIGIKGPLGNSFLDKIDSKGKDVLVIGGGIGLPPLRSMIDHIFNHRSDYRDFTILYGARTPADRVYKYQLSEWEKKTDLKLIQTVDVADKEWTGNVGVVTTLFPKLKLDIPNTVVYTCGPPIMIKFVIIELLKLGLPEKQIVSTLERYMKCGVGKCGHCCIGNKYVCTEGPVFNYTEIKGLAEEAF